MQQKGENKIMAKYYYGQIKHTRNAQKYFLNEVKLIIKRQNLKMNPNELDC